jgi:hypothetical protein
MKCNYSAGIIPKVWYFRKRINPSMELLKPSMASKIPETPYLWHSAKLKLNSCHETRLEYAKYFKQTSLY